MSNGVILFPENAFRGKIYAADGGCTIEAVLVATMGSSGAGERVPGRWRKPLRVSVHDKVSEGGSLERRSDGAGVGCASWCA